MWQSINIYWKKSLTAVLFTVLWKMKLPIVTSLANAAKP